MNKHLLCRHVVLPDDIAKVLPKDRLLSEVKMWQPAVVKLAAIVFLAVPRLMGT